MADNKMLTIDGNEAAARIAYLTNEVIAIYPITPASPMGELSDQWAAEGKPNLWRSIPHIIEMQSEAGAAGAIHGSLQSGALTTTFTASQGLLLMIPNMYKIAGELTPTVFHIAARSLAAQALSIFGDHSDVMAARSTGFCLLAAGSVQEVMDFALIAQAASLQGRLPMLHFFDGFRTSHEISKIEAVESSVARAMIDEATITAHRNRALSPEHPVLRGSSQNPDVYFQARESVNPYYQRMPAVVQQLMDRFAELTGRRYRLFDYVGAEDAERVVVMGSAAETVHETVEHLNASGERIGLLKVRLFRPLDSRALIDALPATVQRIAVLDRTKEPGADGEPLYKDVVTALAQDGCRGTGRFNTMPLVVGGRYGLSSKEFNPGMVKAVFDHLNEERPKNSFTIGINDDVGGSSLEWDNCYRTDAGREMKCALFYGLGADGTVSANKNSIKIIGESTDLYTQGYFVYDSKKSGAVTVSHLRFGPKPIRSSYLIGDDQAHFVACHQQVFLERYDMLDKATVGATFLLNSSVRLEEVWETLPRSMQQQLIDKQINFYLIDAYAVAVKVGLGRRINTIMQACFFELSHVVESRVAVSAIKVAAEQSYAKAGERILKANIAAIDQALAHLHRVELPNETNSTFEKPPVISEDAPQFVQQVTAEIIAGWGDAIPVSLMPNDGTFPLGTAAYEKRNLALEVPVVETDLCTQCGKCVFVCPHSVIRSKIFPAEMSNNAPVTFKHVPLRSKAYPTGLEISYQVAVEDCTGCALCVEVCPIRDKQQPGRKAINMAPQPPLREQERENWNFFIKLPEYERSQLKANTIPASMVMEPLFEFSGACSGCGETPYLRLATQLFGDRMVVANATGCSSIYGGNLPTTPWTTNSEGRGPAWSNSLFEDNAEFGLGMRVAIDKQREYATELLRRIASQLDRDLVDSILESEQSDEAEITVQRERIVLLREKLEQNATDEAKELLAVVDTLISRSVWIVGGDGWGYDIGFGGLDHVLASGRNVNVLLLDTEVYSNTGGQTSKATPRGAVAKFSAAGKVTKKKDLFHIAMDYEGVYVAQVAFGAKDVQTLRAFIEAESYEGPSLIIAYSPCIAHGVDLKNNLRQQDLAVRSGHWPLLRYDPRKLKLGENPLRLDSKMPSIPFRDYAATEARFSVLKRSHPDSAEQLFERAQRDIYERYHHYQELASLKVDDEQGTDEVERSKP
ncbi:pyruvate:ferredoxin (flavodoxin) oxidoreductase [Candidatus Reidiella endopervernicosa]|uniref:Pyruvate-flavodoxin oxidoreductase n=1 Tax=Candidatus Reidiella endopervernicosa TaxID=2738883 RepID=A0A6N0HXN0_9GAMM|nr:pyruvate:ferredoxin (flavodoxin) oxidoreductase [Candidatus Reidiella endopervernicosa]QKQ27125.1 pyruvate:ferredoxin (flavodoxin) oxidoreductase [Candidatus Reidiella endopervernicosa]